MSAGGYSGTPLAQKLGLLDCVAEEGLRYMKQINDMTDKLARPWSAAPAFDGKPALAAAGLAFPAEYAAFV